MKLHSKLTKYLVENHPLLFHSKFFQLTGCGLLMWLSSLLIGYLFTTKSVLRNNYIESYYFTSFFVMFHVLACVIILSVWAIHFYKMKPVRNYYPLQKGYFSKLFLLLFFPFVLLISAYFPFTAGATLRTKALLPKEEFENDKRISNLAYPFLMCSPEEYTFSHKVYPDPFPIDYFVLDEDTESERYAEDMEYGKFDHMYYLPELANQSYISEKEIKKGKKLIDYLQENDSALVLNGNRYIFYRSKVVYTDQDSCVSNNFVSEFVELDSKVASEITSNSFLNFSKAILIESPSNSLWKTKYDYEHYSLRELDSTFLANGIPVIQKIVNSQDYEKVRRIIEDFIKILEKHDIGHSFDVDLLLDYLKVKEFSNINYGIVNTYKKKYWDFEERDLSYYDENENYIDSFVAYHYTPLETKLIKELMYFELSELQKLNTNFNQARTSDDRSDFWYFVLIFAFFLTSFVVWFEFAEIKSLLLSIPIGGGIAILISVFMMAMNSYTYQGDLINQMGLFIILAILIGVSISLILSPFSNRFASSIALNITFVLSHFVIFHLSWIINRASRESVIDLNSNCETYVERELMPFVESPWFFLLAGIIGVFLFYKLVPIWKAKKE